MISGDLMALARPISTVTPLPGNPRRGQVTVIAASLVKFGQRKPIVVRRSDGVVIAGNHTLAAALSLGWSEIAVTYVDDDDETSVAFALADNRTSDLGTYDDLFLADMLRSVQTFDATLMADLAWADEDIARIIESAALMSPVSYDASEAFALLPNGDRADATQITFTVTLDQGEVIKDALGQAKRSDRIGPSENLNSNGNAIYLICSEWLSNVG